MKWIAAVAVAVLMVFPAAANDEPSESASYSGGSFAEPCGSSKSVCFSLQPTDRFVSFGAFENGPPPSQVALLHVRSVAYEFRFEDANGNVVGTCSPLAPYTHKAPGISWQPNCDAGRGYGCHETTGWSVESTPRPDRLKITLLDAATGALVCANHVPWVETTRAPAPGLSGSVWFRSVIHD